MKPRHVIIPVTFIVTLMLMTQIVYAAHVMGNSHHILLYNIDSVNGLTGDPVEDENISILSSDRSKAKISPLIT